MKKRAVKQEAGTKTPKKEKDVKGWKEVRSKRRLNEKSQEVNTPQSERRSAARRRMSSSAEPVSGELLIQSQKCFSNKVKLGPVLI